MSTYYHLKCNVCGIAWDEHFPPNAAFKYACIVPMRWPIQIPASGLDPLPPTRPQPIMPSLNGHPVEHLKATVKGKPKRIR